MKSGFSCWNIYDCVARSSTNYPDLVQTWTESIWAKPAPYVQACGFGANGRGAPNSHWPSKGLPARETPNNASLPSINSETAEKNPPAGIWRDGEKGLVLWCGGWGGLLATAGYGPRGCAGGPRTTLCTREPRRMGCRDSKGMTDVAGKTNFPHDVRTSSLTSHGGG